MVSIIEALSGIRQWLRRDQFERDMDDEMRFHVEMEARDLRRRGLPEAQARTGALAAFGGHAHFKEQARRDLPLTWLGDLRADLRYAGRSLRRTPAFTIVAVLTLAAGIGANGALFGLADIAAFRPLPVRDPARLYAISGQHQDGSLLNLSYPVVEDIRRGAPAFAGVAAFTESMVSVGNGAEAIGAWAMHVSGNYFSLLGVRPQLGRAFEADEDRLPVAVVSDGFWRTQLAGDRAVIGRVVRVNGAPFTIIGVAPRDFHGTRLLTFTPSLWLPLGMHAQTLPASGDLLRNRQATRFNALGRLAQGTPDNALGQLRALARQLSIEHPQTSAAASLTLLSNRTAINPWLASQQRLKTIGVLSLVAGWVVLLVACANVANLLLSRVVGRGREIATRLALGATRPRLARQFLTESLLLAALGTLAALPMTSVALRATRTMTPPLDFSTSFAPALNMRALLFMSAAAIGSVVASGLLPILYAFRRDIAGLLRGLPTRVRRPSASRWRAGLIIGQVALSVVVVAVAALLGRSLTAAYRIDVGFETRRTVAFTVDPALLPGFDAPEIASTYRRIVDELSGLAGAAAIARASSVPLDGSTSTLRVRTPGTTDRAGSIGADYFVVSPDFFATLGIPLVAGRAFTQADTSGVERVVINETLARRLWSDGSEHLGERVLFGDGDGTAVEVVGIARSDVSRRLGDPSRPLLWLSLVRHPVTRTTIIVRASANATELLPQIRDLMHRVAPDLPLVGLRTMHERIELAYSAVESSAVAGSLLGLLASVLAAAGIFGVVSYTVSQRSREMGIRIAMGARPWQLIALLLRSGLKPAAIGLLLGLTATLSLPRGMSAMLYGVSTRDPLALTAASAMLLAVAFVATLIPAWRGTRIDPRRTLQVD